MTLPKFICKVGGRLYCCLLGEVDKEHFGDQCAKCPLKADCKIVQEIYKNVPGDWHALNASGFYGAEFDNCKDKYVRKEMRGVAKGCGLALTYGGTSFTLSESMNCTPEEAQVKIDNFFRKLTVLNVYIKNTTNAVLKTGKVWNALGRMRDVSKWSHSQADSYKQRAKDKAFAQRTALNHPIQSASGDILKIGMVRVDARIVEEGLNPVYGLAVPQELDLKIISYRDILAAQLSSVHDELIHLFHEEHFDEQIPKTYEVMQIKDVIANFGLGFDLECDCEMDPWRSWTARDNYPASRVFLLNRLRRLGDEVPQDLVPNTLMLELSSITPEFLEYLSNLDRTQFGEEPLFQLAVTEGDHVFLNEMQYPKSVLEGLGLPYRFAFVARQA